MLCNDIEYKIFSSDIFFQTYESYVNDVNTFVNQFDNGTVLLNMNITYNYHDYDVDCVNYCFYLSREHNNITKEFCNRKYYRSYVKSDIINSSEIKTLLANTTYAYNAVAYVEVKANKKYYTCLHY